MYNRKKELDAIYNAKVDVEAANYTNTEAEAKANAEAAFFEALAGEAEAMAAAYRAEAKAAKAVYNSYTAAPTYAKAAYVAAYNEAYYASRGIDPKNYIDAAKAAATVYAAKVYEAVEAAYADGFAAVATATASFMEDDYE